MKINDDSWAPVEGLLPAKTQTPPSTQGLIWTWAHKTPSDSGPHHHQNPLPSACSTDHHRTSPPTPEEQSSFSDSQKWWRPYCCPSADWSHCRAHSSVPHPPTCGPSEARNPGSSMGPGMPLWRSNQAIKQSSKDVYCVGEGESCGGLNKGRGGGIGTRNTTHLQVIKGWLILKPEVASRFLRRWWGSWGGRLSETSWLLPFHIKEWSLVYTLQG